MWNARNITSFLKEKNNLLNIQLVCIQSVHRSLKIVHRFLFERSTSFHWKNLHTKQGENKFIRHWYSFTNNNKVKSAFITTVNWRITTENENNKETI